MADDSGARPLPRRVPGATVSPGQPVARVERLVIPEDMRQRLLTAIADELRRDEAEARRAAQAEILSAADPQAAAAPGEADLQIPAPAAHQVAAPDQPDLRGPVLDPVADQAAASAPTVWSPVPRPADPLPLALYQAGHGAPAPGQADLQAPPPDRPDPRPVVPLPRRAPGTNGAPPPPAVVRRKFLPPSLLGRWLDPDVHTEPLPRITGIRADSPAAPDVAHHAGDPAAAPTLPTGTPPLPPTSPGSAPPGSAEAGAAPPAGVFAAPAPPGNGARVPAPAAPPAGRKLERSGRRYRVAGLLVAVIALVIAAVVALLLSGRGGTNGHSGLGAPGAGTGERSLAAAWVAGQVTRAAMVACDPVMCHTLAAHGVPARVLDPLGPGTTSPLRSEIIVATAQVRARFGSLLGAGYAPAVLASFGSGPQRIEIRQTSRHGAAAYRAMLGADLLSRKTSGAELLRIKRIAMAPIARHELSAGRVDSRLLIAISHMASVRPMYIINFGSVAPGADPDLPLRFADLAETGRAHSPFGRSAGYVRSMVSFLHAQGAPFRPAHVATVQLATGTKALRIEFPAPSPLGLLGPARASPDRGALPPAGV